MSLPLSLSAAILRERMKHISRQQMEKEKQTPSSEIRLDAECLKRRSLKSEAIPYSVVSLKLSMSLYFLLKEIVNLAEQTRSAVGSSRHSEVEKKAWPWSSHPEFLHPPQPSPQLHLLGRGHGGVSLLSDPLSLMANETKWPSNSRGRESRETPEEIPPESGGLSNRL